MHPRHVFTFVFILAVAYFAFLYRALSIGFACLSAMIALILSGFFVIVSVVDASHAFGHLIVLRLPDMSPLWPLRFAIAWTLVSLLLGSWLFWFWRNRCMWELFHCFTFNSGCHCVCSFVFRHLPSEHKHVYIHKHTHAYARRNAHIQTCLYWYLFWLKSILTNRNACLQLPVRQLWLLWSPLCSLPSRPMLMGRTRLAIRLL